MDVPVDVIHLVLEDVSLVAPERVSMPVKDVSTHVRDPAKVHVVGLVKVLLPVNTFSPHTGIVFRYAEDCWCVRL